MYKDVMEKAHTEKMKHLDEMQRQRDLRREANQKIIEFTERLKNCPVNADLAQVAIDALHESVCALKSLSVIMMNTAMFWRGMKEHCENLASEAIQREIKSAMALPKEERILFWTARPFKTKAIKYYSQWVALNDICGRYMVQIKDTRRDLYKYLQENPTIEESRTNVTRLAIAFKEELEKEQEKIAEKDKQANKEREDLQNEKTE